MPDFKDLFSRQSADYARYRPDYPPELFRFLASTVKRTDRAWDCGTGNGQAARMLARHFAAVIATDPSDKQLSQAAAHPRVKYHKAAAEDSKIESASIDLTSVAQAFHWFNAEKFAAEVARVSRPGAALAIWCYSQAQVAPEVRRVVNRLYEDILGPYWDPERKLVDEQYAGVRLPFEILEAPPFKISVSWSLEHFAGYLNTWSALQKYEAKHGRNPLEDIRDDLIAAWGGTGEKTVSWELGLKLWRVRP
jgi:SAM-dependent methyltransferase